MLFPHCPNPVCINLSAPKQKTDFRYTVRTTQKHLERSSATSAMTAKGLIPPRLFPSITMRKRCPIV